MRRVVVTGLGLVTPLGLGNASRDDFQSAFADIPGVRQTWRRLIDGHCGITSIKDRSPEFALLPSQVAGIVPDGTKNDAKWDPKEHLSPTVCAA